MKSILLNKDKPPDILFHGSNYSSGLLSPSFFITGKERFWDDTESNHFLYFTSDKMMAVYMAYASLLEGFYALTEFHLEEEKIRVKTDFPFNIRETLQNTVYLYEVVPDSSFVLVNNKINGLKNEWKTQKKVVPKGCTSHKYRAFIKPENVIKM